MIGILLKYPCRRKIQLLKPKASIIKLNILRKIEDLHNRASDTNFVWFPFTKLKPPPHKRLNFRYRIKMTLLFGPYFSFYNFLRLVLFGYTMAPTEFAISTVKFTIFFFFWFNTVTAFFWNRRADRLAIAGSVAPATTESSVGVKDKCQ